MSETFELRGEYIELHKLLKLTGLCASGGEAKAAAGAGQVRVDGEVEMRKRCKLKKGQRVEFAGHTIEIV